MVVVWLCQCGGVVEASNSDRNESHENRGRRNSGRVSDVRDRYEMVESWDDFELVVHRNGEAKECSSVWKGPTLKAAFLEAFQKLLEQSPSNREKDASLSRLTSYQADAIFTSAFRQLFYENNECASTDNYYDVEGEDKTSPSFLDFCDMGEERTVIWPDHNYLIPFPDPLMDDSMEQVHSYLPCHYYTREGLSIRSISHLSQLMWTNVQSSLECSDSQNTDPAENPQSCHSTNTHKVFHMYAVAAGRPFMFAPAYVGETFYLDHLRDTPIINGERSRTHLTVLSIQPRVFEVHNFFSKEESNAIVQRALAETSETHRIKRSSTGASGYNVNSQRTSENGFDTNGPDAMVVKRRSFSVLGFPKYHESFADGLQVLRYNQTTAYIPHMDWMSDMYHQQIHNYDSARVGTNRFATILLYMTDLEPQDGGETVFTKAPPLGVRKEDMLTNQEALQQLKNSGDLQDLFTNGSWQEKMVATCRSRLAIRPMAAKSILFYSQHPNGEEDTSSIHGGCPVLSGTKWAANLWVWNGPRNSYPGSPKNQEVVERNRQNTQQTQTEQTEQINVKHVTFTNKGRDQTFAQADLYYEDTFWGSFSHGDPTHSVNSYEGHVWNIKTKGQNPTILKTWIITDKKNQMFTV